MKNKRIGIVIMIMLMVLLFSTTAVSFADAEGEVSEGDFQEELLENELLADDILIEDQELDLLVPFASLSFDIKASFKTDSGKGVATVSAVRGKSDKMVSTIKLQVYSESQKKYVDSSAKAATKSKSGSIITHKASFSVSSQKKYRVKITIKAYEGSDTDSQTVYRTLV